MKKQTTSESFSLDHLTEVEFENFCYDLLHELGFVNITWRKGTGLSSSPADQGRDIECYFPRKDVDGTTHQEKWFVECKNYEKGVPPEKIQGALSWAKAERPDKLLIIASNFLSNPTKEYIEKLKQNERPHFAIKFWERPELEKMAATRTRLLRKYKIGGDFPHLAIMHPAHIMYLRELSTTGLDSYFELLDSLNPEKRRTIVSFTEYILIRPRIGEPVTGKETISELLIDKVGYAEYRKKCYELARYLEEKLLVSAIVDFTLKGLFALADSTSIDIGIEKQKGLLEGFLAEREVGEDVDVLDDLIRMTQAKIESYDDDVKKNYALYEYFCENVVQQLLIQKWIGGSGKFTIPPIKFGGTGTVGSPNK